MQQDHDNLSLQVTITRTNKTNGKRRNEILIQQTLPGGSTRQASKPEPTTSKTTSTMSIFPKFTNKSRISPGSTEGDIITN